jgi:hypothetical protein
MASNAVRHRFVNRVPIFRQCYPLLDAWSIARNLQSPLWDTAGTLALCGSPIKHNAVPVMCGRKLQVYNLDDTVKPDAIWRIPSHVVAGKVVFGAFALQLERRAEVDGFKRRQWTLKDGAKAVTMDNLINVDDGCHRTWRGQVLERKHGAALKAAAATRTDATNVWVAQRDAERYFTVKPDPLIVVSGGVPFHNIATLALRDVTTVITPM